MAVKGFTVSAGFHIRHFYARTMHPNEDEVTFLLEFAAGIFMALL